MPESIGVVGLGIMGSAMAANLMKAGYPVVGYDVLTTRRRAHRRAGGQAARSCREVAGEADVIVCSLPSAEALLRTAAELAESPRRPRIVIETSTLAVDVKHEARRMLRAGGTTLLDCPLSGTGAQAETGDVIVFASGDRAAYRRARPILHAFARSPHYVGEFGTGSKFKFVANLLVAVHNVAAAEALVLAMKAGLDPALVLKVVSAGAGSSRVLQLRGPMMVKGHYSPATMKLGVWQKDMTIITEFARAVGCPTPLFAASAPVYAAAIGMGRELDDTAAVCAVLEKMADYHRPAPRGARRRTAARRS
jgi:L-threonate 2-dehydrogenase